MGLNRSALGMALVTCCSVALLGVHWQGLSVAGAAYPSSQALVHFTGWQAWAPYVMLASLLAWCIPRCVDALKADGAATAAPPPRLLAASSGRNWRHPTLPALLHWQIGKRLREEQPGS